MHPYERETCQIMIERDFAVPAEFVVTASTVITLLPLVYIIIFMAIDAFRSDFVFIEVAFVTLSAGYFFMFTEKRKIGFFIVIEFKSLPGRGSVAVGTFLAISAFMVIVALMAAITLLRYLFLQVARSVATVACGVLMFADQWEIGLLLMVKVRLFPLTAFMTALTFFAVS